MRVSPAPSHPPPLFPSSRCCCLRYYYQHHYLNCPLAARRVWPRYVPRRIPLLLALCPPRPPQRHLGAVATDRTSFEPTLRSDCDSYVHIGRIASGWGRMCIGGWESLGQSSVRVIIENKRDRKGDAVRDWSVECEWQTVWARP